MRASQCNQAPVQGGHKIRSLGRVGGGASCVQREEDWGLQEKAWPLILQSPEEPGSACWDPPPLLCHAPASASRPESAQPAAPFIHQLWAEAAVGSSEGCRCLTLTGPQGWGCVAAGKHEEASPLLHPNHSPGTSYPGGTGLPLTASNRTE